MEFDAIARQFLKSCGLTISSRFLTRQLRSHPDYPYLTSLTDLLDDLGIEHLVIDADKTKLEDFPFPVLVHTSSEGTDAFEIIRSLKEVNRNKEGFLKRWDGIVLMVDKNSRIIHEEQENFLKEEKINKWVSLAALAGIAHMYIITIVLKWEPVTFMVSLLSAGGCFICSLLVLRSLGKENAISKKLCQGEGQSGCDKVLYSKGAEIPGFLSLADLGLLYFSTQFLFLLLGQLTLSSSLNLLLLVIPAGLSVIFSFVSFWYQGLVVKGWCRMCLIVAGIIWAQAILLLSARSLWINGFEPNGILSAALLFLTLFFLFFAALFFIKKFYRRAALYDSKEIDILSWKRNAGIFSTFLNQQRQVENQVWQDDILLGDRNAPIQLLVVNNPYCIPCAREYTQLQMLLKAYPDLVCVIIRWAVISRDPSDRRNLAIDLLLDACLSPNGKNSQETILHDWFATMDPEIWKSKYGNLLSKETYRHQALLNKHADWYMQNNITHTPTVFLNGYELPKQYTLNDLKLLIPLIAEPGIPVLQKQVF
ncbi:vitamin K epoxide reductase family protein [Flavitalea flava]